jgi:hypothetical protein
MLRRSGRPSNQPTRPPLTYAEGIPQSEQPFLELAAWVFPSRDRQREKDGVHLWTNGLGRTEEHRRRRQRS